MKRLISLIALFLLFGAAETGANAQLQNQLQEHASPYLAMHANDPVAWQAWNQDILDRAKRENKLLFVSIGYFACHWCHVMQRESYSDAQVAQYLNKDFIPVKIDRELNPALDAYLIEFVRRTRGHAGWPLNVFVTPEGNPVVGATYVPKSQFIKLLKQLNTMWTKDNAYLREMAAQAAAIQKGQKLEKIKPLSADFGRQLETQFMQQSMQIANEMQGGFGDQTKFPMTSQLRLLLKTYERKPYQRVADFLQLTFEQMATQGLRDHIGGGFFRYTTDPDWQTPHFEKMLYDNASLALLYLEAGRVFKRKDFIAIAEEVLDFMLRELQTPQGGMVASLSAVDDHGVEGGYYLWQKVNLKKLLSQPQWEAVSLLWGLQRAVPFEAGYLPYHDMSPDDVAKQLGLKIEQLMPVIAQAQQRLLKERKNRTIPVDTKQLAAWNGLALKALAYGARVSGKEKFRLAAQKLRNYIVDTLWNGNRLYRAVGKDGPMGQAGLEDFSYAIDGLYAWWQVNAYAKDLELVKRWISYAWERFYTTSGWQLSDEMLIKHDFGVPIIADNPMPSPSSVLLSVSLKVAHQSKDEKLRARVLQALSIGHELLGKQGFNYATQISLIADYQRMQRLRKKEMK